jgi:hypothetical protein
MHGHGDQTANCDCSGDAGWNGDPSMVDQLMKITIKRSKVSAALIKQLEAAGYKITIIIGGI